MSSTICDELRWDNCIQPLSPKKGPNQYCKKCEITRWIVWVTIFGVAGEPTRVKDQRWWGTVMEREFSHKNGGMPTVPYPMMGAKPFWPSLNMREKNPIRWVYRSGFLTKFENEIEDPILGF